MGDAYGMDADQPGAICVRHAVENCGAVPAPEGADLDEMFAKDGYEVLRHPCEQPPDWRPEEPLAPGLKKLTEFTAMQLMGNGTGQPGKDAKRNKNYAKAWEVYASAAIVGGAAQGGARRADARDGGRPRGGAREAAAGARRGARRAGGRRRWCGRRR